MDRKLPRLSHDEAGLRSALATRLRALSVHLSETSPFVLAVAEVVPRSLGERLAGHFGECLLLVEPTYDRALGLIGTNAAMESAALSHELVERYLAPGLRLLPHRRGTPPWCAERACVAYVELDDGRSKAAVRAFLDLDAFDPARTRTGLGLARTLPIELGLQLGRVALRVSELRSLAHGDVVVCEEGEAFGWRGVVDGSSQELALAEREGTLVLQGRIPRQTMEDTRMQKSRNGLSSIDDARVEVALEAARVVTTLSELEALSVGSVLVSSRSVSRLVTLRVGGQPVARGELVDVDGQLGVRITELASADAAQ